MRYRMLAVTILFFASCQGTPLGRREREPARAGDTQAPPRVTAAPSSRAPALAPRRGWPVPQRCTGGGDALCVGPDGEPGLRCDGACTNPCPPGMGVERWGSHCAKLCSSAAECPDGVCTERGTCDRWSRPPEDCEELPQAERSCITDDGDEGFRCRPGGDCYAFCKPGLRFRGATHCVKPCTSDADCPGGFCSENRESEGDYRFCLPMCPSEGCPYPWE